MAKYNVWDGDGSTRPFNSLTAAGKYAYASMKRVFDKWPRTEMEARVMFGPDNQYTGKYFGRIHYKRWRIAYFWNGSTMQKLKADGTLGPLTADEKAVIRKVENDPTNW